MRADGQGPLPGNVRLCKKNVVADPVTVEQCQPWAQVVKGADVMLATKQLCQFRAVGRSCFYGSDWCDHAIVDDNRSRIPEDSATALRGRTDLQLPELGKERMVHVLMDDRRHLAIPVQEVLQPLLGILLLGHHVAVCCYCT